MNKLGDAANWHHFVLAAYQQSDGQLDVCCYWQVEADQFTITHTFLSLFPFLSLLSFPAAIHFLYATPLRTPPPPPHGPVRARWCFTVVSVSMFCMLACLRLPKQLSARANTEPWDSLGLLAPRHATTCQTFSLHTHVLEVLSL